MKRKTMAILSAAVVITAVMAGCSSNKETETTAPAAAAPETSAETEPQKEQLKKVDMLIAGGDGAGLVAAVQAVKDGTDPSGILIVTSSGELAEDVAAMGDYMNASNTDEQFEQEIDDSFEAYLADIRKAGNEMNNQEMAEFVAENSEEALDWVKDAGIELEGVTKQEGSSMARSYAAAGDRKLSEALRETLLKEVENLNIQVVTDTTVDEIVFGEDKTVEAVILTGSEGTKTVECSSLVVTDKELLPLLESQALSFMKSADEQVTGLIVNNCAEVLDESGELVPGLYAAGAMTETAVNGEKALMGNQITGTVLFGATAGTEAAIYAADNK